MKTKSTTRLVEVNDVVRIVIGWAAVGALTALGPVLEPPLAPVVVAVALTAIIAVIILCAFGVVKQAEALAHKLGDPYGSLVLTLSIVLIEVILISAMMLGPGEHATIARDSVMAVSMIILNLVLGLCLLLGGLRFGSMRFNRAGVSTYLSTILVLSIVAFGIPSVAGNDGGYSTSQTVPVIVFTVAVYAFFLWRQTGKQAGDFQEVTESRADALPAEERVGIGQILKQNAREIAIRVVLLVVTVLPIVLLSHDMAVLVDEGLMMLGAPVELAGLLIAMIVFLPESLTSVRAALNGEFQRVSNLCHGALVSTLALTIPAVLAIGLLTGQQVVLAETPINLLLLAATMLLSAVTFGSRTSNAMHGVNHLILFALYVLMLVG